MEFNRGGQKKILGFGLFIAFANAAPAFTNSTTSGSRSSSISHMTTTSPPATKGTLIPTASSSSSNFTPHGWITAPIMPPPCFPDAGQVCDREGQPTYAYDIAPYINVYYTPGAHNYSPAYASQVSYCEDLWASSLTEWLHTAPITYGSLIPQTTIWDSEPEFARIWNTETVTSTVVDTQTDTLTIQGYDGLSATSFSTTTGMSVDFEGVEVTYTQTFAIVEITYTETSYMGSAWPFTTSTYTGWTSAGFTQAEYRPAGYLSDFTYVPTSPCCKECTLFGGSVQVFYWPPATELPAVSTLTNSAKFTFKSPSVYVAFQSLYATDFCGTVGGDVYDATTLAFKESDLSTAPAYFWNTAEYNASQPFLPPLYAAATWEDQKSCTDITKSFYQWVRSDVGADYAYYNGVETYDAIPTDWPTESSTFYHYTVTNNPCSPTMSVPTELFTINTLWSTCMQGIAGFFDPPYPLSAGNGLVAFATTAADPVTDNPVTTSVAVAGQTVASVTPTATKAAVNVDPTTSVTNDPQAQKPSSTAKDPPVPASSYNPPTTSPSSASNESPVQVLSNDLPAPSATSVPNDPPTQLLTSSEDPPPAVVTIGSSTITANSASGFVIASQTLTPGGEITHSGTILSLDPSGSAVIFGGITTQILTHTTSASAVFIIGSQTLSVGGPAVTASGTTYSMLAGGSSVVVDGGMQPLSGLMAITPEYAVDSQTLVPGGSAIMVSGTPVSLQKGGSSVVVGGQTEALSAFLGPSTTKVSLGGIIATIGGFASPESTSVSTSSSMQVPGSGYNGTLFFGGAERSRGSSLWVLGVMLGIGVVGLSWLQ